MLKKDKEDRNQVVIFSMDDFVPKDHLLRKIDKAVDFSKIYEFVEDLYCHDNGRPSIDPVVLFKMVMIQHIYAIPSLKRTAEEIQMNVAYRWFLGYTMLDKIPHYATISYNFLHRFTPEVIDNVFYWILSEIEKAGYLSPEMVFIDGTHVKANANIKKTIKKKIPGVAKIYEEQLLEEINKDREEHGKDPFDGPKPPEEKEINVPVNDAESGIFHKGEHEKKCAYVVQTAVDKNGYVLESTVNAGNMHDSIAFDGIYDRLVENFGADIEFVVADAGYKTPHIARKITEDGYIAVLPYTRPKGRKNSFRVKDYKYDKQRDAVICPEGYELRYSTTTREGYKQYKSDKKVCAFCPSREKCTKNKNCIKTYSRHVWAEYLELADENRFEYKDIYDKRKETVERVFAIAKERHAMRYTPYVGLKQVSNWVRLKYAAMNLKKYAMRLFRYGLPYRYLLNISGIFFLY